MSAPRGLALYDNSNREFTVQPGCPWYQAQQTYGAPNVNWCEATRCSWINEPANTWSNLGFLFVGILLIKRMATAPAARFGWVVIVMGLLSAVYHATNNYLTQYFDFVGMALMTSYLIAAAFGRLTQGRIGSFGAVYGAAFSVNLIALMCFDITNTPIQMMLGLNVLAILTVEIAAGWREGSLRRYGVFAAGMAVLALAQVFAQIDLRRIHCEADHPWLHGHVLWHILCAVGMYLAGIHLEKMQKSVRPS